ncbi:TM7S3/TM198-like domain-containing protein [Nocardioides alcanivorans]|uniref:TM7S3/TM198-like domain-containing protein n=1 Tax=Nocardioides alcanivorans TaxID=2897352 RepID=UPI001F1A6339|nr:DUF4203 domain-containing protein [Nocardioides alcanivorans]
MSGLILILVGALLCFAGSKSVRLAVLTAGFGTGWLLAELFDASTTVALVIALAAAFATLVTALLVSKSLFFVAGVVVGSVVGAKIFVIIADQPRDWLAAIVVVPAVALLCGWLTARWEKTFLRWGTAAAGAALILSGVGRTGVDGTDHLWRPESTVGAVLLAGLWIAVTVVGQRVQAGDAKGAEDQKKPAH